MRLAYAVGVTRRDFLRLSLWGGGVLVAGTGALHLWPTARELRPRRALRFLDDSKFAVLAAVAARVCAGVPTADAIEIAHAVEASMTTTPPEVREQFVQLLGFLESAAAGLFFDGRPQPFSRLTPAGQDEALFAFRDSRLGLRRAGYQALRKLCIGACYADARTWPGVGYPGPPQIQLPADYVVAP